MAATLVAPPRLRRSASVLAVVYGSAVGIAVIAAGWHRPSDVAGAYFVPTAWAALAGLVSAAHQRRRGHGTRWPRASTARNLLGLAAALLTAGYAATLAIVAASRSGQVDWTAVDGAFAGACATVAALAALLMAALLASVTEPGENIPDYDERDGYRAQRADGTYAHSSGIQGACSRYGGVRYRVERS
jgi:hypothetical protein